jgi:MFS transporter, SP family, sugar:H+ symporter
MPLIRVDPGRTSLWENRKCFFIMAFIATSAFQYGLDYGKVGGVQAMKGFLEVFGEPNPRSPIGWNLSTVVQQLIASFMIVGAFLASFTTGFLGRFPRRYCLILASVLCWISGAIMVSNQVIREAER